ncbi:MAG: hypothetical protein ABI743_13120 [bacterium]
MASVLITGFLPESVEVENASAQLAASVERKAPAGWATAFLPQSSQWLRTAVPQLLTEHQPALTVLCGQAPGRNHLSLESVALNLMSFRVADIDGFAPKEQPIIPEAPLALKTSLGLHAAAERLRIAHLPAQVSYHAGLFLCNQAYFHALHHLLYHGAPWQRVVFLHIPITPSQVNREKGMSDKPCLTTETVAAGLNLLVAALQSSSRDGRPEEAGETESTGDVAGLSSVERLGLLH